ncbi:potassium channel family protein [Natronorubrum tibetense]|uniref:Potassium channel protein n=1 Tax=Natronorubrum tibetense GA33 TaxID=1114856 RepID=M0QT45_9EURY|nr:TrkA C-terminal domain-containing protein [Natronorubrum tibetense]ELY46853.1 potassium channel protein [Natronorubrum tibetense GA33]
MREISYEPRNVRETLVELKDTSELAVDLAYSAVRYDDADLADEVVELEARVNYLQYHSRIALMLAAKRAEEAERLVGLFQVASSAVRITEAAGDVARIVLEEDGVPAAFEHAFPDADERLVRATVGEDSDFAGSRLRELELDLKEGVRLIAIRRAGEWSFAPDGDDRLQVGDVVVGRGPRDGIESVYRRATGEAFPAPTEPPETTADLERAADAVVELKDMAELAVGLAYGAARFDSDELAREVISLEEQSDVRKADLETWVIETGGDWNADELRGLLHLAAASEAICDAAVDIAEVVLRDVELPPVFGAALEDSEEVIAAVTVIAESDLDGTTIADLEFEEGAGVVVLAIRRSGGNAWTFDPTGDLVCAAGDSLLVRGPPVGVDHLRELAGNGDGLA